MGTEKEFKGTPAHLEWWNSLTDDEAISILKEEGIYGHDQGVNEQEIEEFYKMYGSKH